MQAVLNIVIATDAFHCSATAAGAMNDYAGKIVAMTPDALAPYDTSCAGKYADMDKLCESNPCLHSGPPPADPG